MEKLVLKGTDFDAYSNYKKKSLNFEGDIIIKSNRNVFFTNLIAKGKIIHGGGLEVTKNIKASSIEVNHHIHAGREIVVNYLLKAGWEIRAGKNITCCTIISGREITCKELNVSTNCFAGICAHEKIKDTDRVIICDKFNGDAFINGFLVEKTLK
jgi:hypothetical protein